MGRYFSDVVAGDPSVGELVKIPLPWTKPFQLIFEESVASMEMMVVMEEIS